jgi:hypothetical protein
VKWYLAGCPLCGGDLYEDEWTNGAICVSCEHRPPRPDPGGRRLDLIRVRPRGRVAARRPLTSGALTGAATPAPQAPVRTTDYSPNGLSLGASERVPSPTRAESLR